MFLLNFLKPTRLVWKIFITIISIIVFLFVIAIFLNSGSSLSFFLILVPLLLAEMLGLPVFESMCGEGAFICFDPPNAFGWVLLPMIYLIISYIVAVIISKIVIRFKK